MKHLISLLLLLGSVSLFAQSQDYRLFRDGVQYLYGNDPNEIEFGMKLNGECDSTYIQMSGSCSTPGVRNAQQSSFAGLEVCQGADTTTMRLLDGRIVYLIPRMDVGQSWLVTKENNLSIFAKVDSMRFESFLGLTDSVKYISFHAITLDNFTINSIRIGQKTGLLNAVFFWNLLVCRNPMLLLNGLSEPRAGLQYTSAPDFLEPDDGQEIHFEEVDFIGCNSCSDGSYNQYDEYQLTLENYNLSDSGDSATYRYRGPKLSYKVSIENQIPYDSVLQENYVYTSTITTQEYEILTQQPGAMVRYLLDVNGGIRTLRNATTPLIVTNNDCFGEYRRLGQPYFLANGSYSTSSDTPDGIAHLQGTGLRFQDPRFQVSPIRRNMVYLKSANRECGTPYNFSGIVSTNILSLNSTIKIFPNPTNDLTTLSLPVTGQFEVEIMDLHGRKLASYQRVSGELSLGLQAFSAGIYVVTVVRNGKILGRRRLVVR